MTGATREQTRPGNVPADRVVDFDVYAIGAPGDDFFACWAALQGPGRPDLVWTQRNGGHWIATGGDVIAALFPAPELSNRISSVPREGADLMEFLPLNADAPDHARYRAAVVKALDAKRVLSLAPMIRDLARTLSASIRQAGKCDFVSEFAEVLPVHVFLTLVGLPPADRPMLRQFVEQLNRPDGSITPEQLVEQVSAYLRPYVEARLATPGGDLLSQVLKTPIDGRAWTFDEAMRVARNLLLGGLDTVAAMLGFVMHYLARHPEHRAALRDDPAIIPKIAPELVRRFGSVTNGRVVARELEIDGVRLAVDDMVLLPTMLYNLDVRCFADPQAVDFSRGMPRHMTMGQGPHRCVGASLAQHELVIVLQEWFAQNPDFTLDPAMPATMSGGSVGSLARLPLLVG